MISIRATNIFARPAEADRQFIVYSMTMSAKESLAMILPLPVKQGADEQAVIFLDLSGYVQFFEDLQKGFPVPLPASAPTSRSWSLAAGARPKLEVVQVGSFEASFVPTLMDFSRLDERFRISDAAWKQLPQYHDFGFAVFKLKPGESRIHPMAFSFPRRDRKHLFFPTVHIHDGQVHSQANFDHALYCQPTEHERPETRAWEESFADARRFMKLDRTKGLILAEQHCYRKELRGMLPNRDELIPIAA